MNGERKKFVTSKEACVYFGVSSQTLRKWDKCGIIKTIRTNLNEEQGHRRYDVTSFKDPFKDLPMQQPNVTVDEHIANNDNKKGVCYCRVSSKHQKDDLQRQVDAMHKQYPTYEIIKDIGSGINFKRTGFLKLSKKIISGTLKEIVVAHKDRLCRFGFEYVQWLCNQYDVKLLVQNSDNNKTPQQEITEDLLSIIHVFSCRVNGKRKYAKKTSQEKKIKNNKT